MEITKVYIHKVDREDSSLKGYATVVIDDCFRVNNIRIIEGKSRLFCQMPNRKGKNGEFMDIVHPTNEETRNLFEEKILEEYNKEASEVE